MAKTKLTPSTGAVYGTWLADYQWDETTLTYSFPTNGNAYSYQSKNDVTPFTAGQKNAVRAVLDDISGYTNLKFTEVSGGSGTLRFANEVGKTGAYAWSPWSGEQGGDAFFGTNSLDPDPGDYAYSFFPHEIGHTMGLEHGHESASFNGSQYDSQEYSVMTYSDYVGDTSRSWDTGPIDWPQTMMQLDIAALQFMYGANYSASGEDWSGNSVYRFNPNTGAMTINGASQGTPAGNKIFRTIWDGNGNDTYDLSNYSTNLDIDLRPGEWSTFSSAQLSDLNKSSSDPKYIAKGNVANARLVNGDTRGLIENATGGSGNDVIRGNQVANRLRGNSGNDTLRGEAGNDTLIGGRGRDTLVGGSGKDTFKYESANDSSGSLTDTITDFSVANDTLDLKGLTSAATVLRLLGNFTGNGSSVTTQQTGGDTIVRADLNGDSIADFLVTLRDTIGLKASNILLSNSTTEPPTEPPTQPPSTGGTINGTNANNTLTGTSAGETINGLDGNDILRGYGGNDKLYGNGDDDRLYGGNDDDTLTGGYGNDQLFGENGNDRLFGNNGDDLMVGGAGADIMDGGAGRDTFRYDAASHSSGANIDTINGFSVTEDVLDLKGLTSASVAVNLLGSFTGSGASLITRQSGGDTTVLVDLNGDKTADFEVKLKGTTGLKASNILLSSTTQPPSEPPSEPPSTGGSIDGTNGNNVISGTNGNDTINGKGGNDTLSGLDGNDIVRGDSGNDKLYGNGDDDKLYGGSGADTATGGYGNDNLFGQGDADRLYGNFGDDLLVGGFGADVLSGGSGRDTFRYNAAAESNGANTDMISDFSVSQDFLDLKGLTSAAITVNLLGNYTGSGASLITRQSGGDTTVMVDLDGNRTTDFQVRLKDTTGLKESNLFLSSSKTPDPDPQPPAGDVQNGTSGANVINGDDNANTQYGLGGNDTLNGKGGNDWQYGGDGADKIYGNAGSDHIYGGNGDDLGLGGYGIDTLRGEAGNDRLYGGFGNDILNGGAGNDTLAGDAENDKLYGEAGNDALYGGDGSDVLVGGAGRDSMSGGQGRDIFRFLSASDSAISAQADVISDFQRGTDDIDLSYLAGPAVSLRLLGNFTGNGASAITRQAGGDTTVLVDVDGDKSADFHVILLDEIGLTTSDFIL